MVTVFVALAMSFSGNGDVASMIEKCQRQQVGARNTRARVARFDFDFIRVTNSYTILKFPLYMTGKSVVIDTHPSHPLNSHTNGIYVGRSQHPPPPLEQNSQIPDVRLAD
jgi:hypothetical protein